MVGMPVGSSRILCCAGEFKQEQEIADSGVFPAFSGTLGNDPWNAVPSRSRNGKSAIPNPKGSNVAHPARFYSLPGVCKAHTPGQPGPLE